MNMGGAAPSLSHKCVVASMCSSMSDLDPQRLVERERREQNEQLLRVLGEERRTEGNRVHFLQEATAHSAGHDGGSCASEAEQRHLEIVFA